MLGNEIKSVCNAFKNIVVFTYFCFASLHTDTKLVVVSMDTQTHYVPLLIVHVEGLKFSSTVLFSIQIVVGKSVSLLFEKRVAMI